MFWCDVVVVVEFVVFVFCCVWVEVVCMFFVWLYDCDWCWYLLVVWYVDDDGEVVMSVCDILLVVDLFVGYCIVDVLFY